MATTRSIIKLKNLLTQTKTYSGINVNKHDLEGIKADINKKLNEMGGVRPVDPNSTTESISGTTCVGYVANTYDKKTVSLVELEEFIMTLPKETCMAVKKTLCNCVSRIYINPCDCVSRTTCECNTQTGCTCDSRTMCECQNRSACNCEGDCRSRSVGCECRSRCGCKYVGDEICSGRTAIDCQARQSVVCGTRTTYSCSGRQFQPLCNCEGRCSCDAEKSFSTI